MKIESELEKAINQMGEAGKIGDEKKFLSAEILYRITKIIGHAPLKRANAETIDKFEERYLITKLRYGGALI